MLIYNIGAHTGESEITDSEPVTVSPSIQVRFTELAIGLIKSSISSFFTGITLVSIWYQEF